MHNSEIFYMIKFNKTKNKLSGKNVGSWAESDDQFGHLLGPAICHIHNFIICSRVKC